MKKQFAVATTAALVLTAIGAPALAQSEKMNIEGLVYFDRNGDNTYDAGDGVRAFGPGVRIINMDTKQVRDVPTGADGRYMIVNLPKAKYTVVNLDMQNYTTTKNAHGVTETVTNADFPLRGYFVTGHSFVDANGDGVKQDAEQAVTGEIKASGKAPDESSAEVSATPGADGAYALDLPMGEFTLTAPTTANGFALAKPRSGKDVDWVTGTLKLTHDSNNRTQKVDLRYFEPKGDAALVNTTISPAKDTYTVGEQIEVKFQLINKGDVPGKLSVVMFGLGSMDAKLLSLSDNVTGTMQDFETVAKLLPGESITVAMKVEILSTELSEIYPFARPFMGPFKDVDHTNQGQPFRKVIKVVEKSTTTPTSPSETTAPTTTTTPAVAKAGNAGLASTGASPLGFLALGALLLAAGAGAFLMARRRRS